MYYIYVTIGSYGVLYNLDLYNFFPLLFSSPPSQIKQRYVSKGECTLSR
jgi:hypothetical protein